MSRIDELRAELGQLEALQRRAEKLRGKKGRIDVSQETLAELEDALGDLPGKDRADGSVRMDIETLVALIDKKLSE